MSEGSEGPALIVEKKKASDELLMTTINHKGPGPTIFYAEMMRKVDSPASLSCTYFFRIVTACLQFFRCSRWCMAECRNFLFGHSWIYSCNFDGNIAWKYSWIDWKFFGIHC